MDWVNTPLNTVLGWYFLAFSRAPSIGLVVISILTGIGMLLVLQKVSDPVKIRLAKRRVQAHLLELRMFQDEPRVVWGAQKALLGANARYMGLMLRPALWMTIPLFLLMIRMEAVYGRSPLPVGQEAVVTMSMRTGLAADNPRLSLTPVEGIAVETPPVRALALRQVSWRIRPQATVSGELGLNVGNTTVKKRIEAGGSQRFVPGLRTGSRWATLWHPDEPRIDAPEVEWIDIEYPGASVALLGMHAPWLIWFLAISMLSALVLKKRFGVVL